MAQLPITDDTYSRLSVLKAKAIISKNGSSITWDDIISAQIDISNKHADEFVEFIKMKKGKSRSGVKNDEWIYNTN